MENRKWILFPSQPNEEMEEGRLPVDPIVQVAIGSHTRDEEKETISLTPHLMADSEIDHEIDSMIRLLEKMRSSGKKELAMLRERMRG